jgi:hypothetical protein
VSAVKYEQSTYIQEDGIIRSHCRETPTLTRDDVLFRSVCLLSTNAAISEDGPLQHNVI